METIHIYHTNDIHSHMENWPRIQEYLQTGKKAHEEKGEDVFLFDIGDFVDRFHPLSEATKGRGNIALLNECGYTAVTIGNNEGVNLSHSDLDHLYDDADFDILAANFYHDDKTYPAWVKPYKVYSTKQGTRIAVIGLTAYFAELFHLLGWHLTEPMNELKQQLHILSGKADVIILLSHLGINHDEKIAEAFPEIDVILGGHTHHVLEEGERVNETLLCAAGKYGHFVGTVTLELSDRKTVLTKRASLIDVQELPPAKGERAIVDEFFQKGKELLSGKVACLSQPLYSHFFQETKLSKMLCEALREWCEADCSFLNAGLLLGPLGAGEVTNFDLLSVCPHPINPCKVELSGRELSRVLLQTKGAAWPEKKIIGLGFRGTIMGKFVYDRIDFKQNNRIIEINGGEIEPARRYSLAVPDMFTFGRFFQDLSSCQQKQYYLPEFLRDLLKWKLQQDK